MQTIRPMYSSPPAHGARIAAAILSDPALYKQWRVSCRLPIFLLGRVDVGSACWILPDGAWCSCVRQTSGLTPRLQAC